MSSPISCSSSIPDFQIGWFFLHSTFSYKKITIGKKIKKTFSITCHIIILSLQNQMPSYLFPFKLSSFFASLLIYHVIIFISFISNQKKFWFLLPPTIPMAAEAKTAKLFSTQNPTSSIKVNLSAIVRYQHVTTNMLVSLCCDITYLLVIL